ncbi:YhjD/YihY/BrkB family envelope integrity protein, partial [Pasteurella multocida]|uniref:YhjD/YihY/BrkB family envelope integrity protein n=1 Tax=Pasteurella multocida TaxID=747 RepID=UPI0035E4477F
AKWPVLILIMIFMVALLYYVSPNIAQPTFRWLSAGSITAVIVAIVAVLGFGFYVSNFGNYNATYGTLAGVI